MNSDPLVQQLQKSFRVALGATTTLVESIQDPQKRDENLSKLRGDWSLVTEEWATKGEVTEQEARNFVDAWFAQRNTASPPGASPPSSGVNQPAAPPDVQADLQELTAQLAAIRAELERMRNSQPPT